MKCNEVTVCLVLSGAKLDSEAELINRLKEYFDPLRVKVFPHPVVAHRFFNSRNAKQTNFSHTVCVYNKRFDPEIGTIFESTIKTQKVLVIDENNGQLLDIAGLISHDHELFLSELPESGFNQNWCDAFGEQPEDQIPPELLVQRYNQTHLVTH